MSTTVRKYDDYKCIWMSSNMIDYKICGNSFDCESCNFYKDIYSFKSSPDISTEKQFEYRTDKIKSAIKRLELCRKLNTHPYYFLKNNVILKNISGDKYCLGLNPAVYVLLDNISSTRFINETNLIEKDDPFFRIEGEWGSTVILSPIKFFLLWDMKLSPKEFYNSKWIGFAETGVEAFEGCLISEEEFNQAISDVNVKLKEYLNSFKNVGETMMDGGTKIKYLYEIFGKDNYLELLQKMFKSG